VAVALGVFVYQAIDFTGCHAQLDETSNVIHQLAVKTPGTNHRLAFRFR
jgi:hypothetical protein